MADVTENRPETDGVVPPPRAMRAPVRLLPGQPGNHAGKLFLPGNAANPGGRPKGIAALVRTETADGAELVAFMLAILRGTRRAPLRLRMEAAAWLADRAFGKPVQALEHGGGGDPLRFTLLLGERQVIYDGDDEGDDAAGR